MRHVAIAIGGGFLLSSAGVYAGQTLEWDARLRHEHVDDAAFSREAAAQTVRARLGVRFAWAQDWAALVEGEGVASAGNRYNSGANGHVHYPSVIDPRSVELNQAWIGHTQARGGFTLGRQRYVLDNHRFIGNVGWRQNEQTFDALALEFSPAKTVVLRYAWLDRVHRVSSDEALDPLARERDLSTHVLNAAYRHGAQQWTGYAYLHDDAHVPAASSATYGLRWTGALGSAVKFGWSAELARQSDHADNPLHFSHRYWLLEPSLQARGITYKLGWESLGGNGRHALQTPLATLHAFNGWADKFPVTPANGLRDRYLSAGGSFGSERGGGKPVWNVVYHDYRPTHGPGRYGREWNASIGYPIAKGWMAMAKAADYQAHGFARDTRKFWLQLEWKGSQDF